MLKLEGEFPLAPKTPVNIQLEDRFDQTRNEQMFYRLLDPMAEKLKGYNYRIFETVVWVRGGSGSCIDELRRTLERLGIETASTCKIEYSTECPDYAIVSQWMNLSDYRVENRLIVIVHLHEESGESKSMENACAFLLTSHYVREEGEKPVYLYQPMSDVTDVEDKMAVFLETGSVLTPKNLWYTGLSRIEKYPLMQALDKKSAHGGTAGYRCLSGRKEYRVSVAGSGICGGCGKICPGGATGSLFRQKQILYYCAFLHEDSYPKKTYPGVTGVIPFILRGWRLYSACYPSLPIVSVSWRKTIRQQSGN